MQILDRPTDPTVDFLWSLRETPVGRAQLDLKVPFGRSGVGVTLDEHLRRMRAEGRDVDGSPLVR
jgi:hypothetical protein